MHCLITAGPTYEPLDNVRRITNFSTGQLGSELARFLIGRGHEVTLLLGEQATYRGPLPDRTLVRFTTTQDLETRLQALSAGPVQAVFHAAAVSDFKFGNIWIRSEDNRLTEAKSGKISTRAGVLLAELIPTAKIILQLRSWFPSSRLIGWKFEVDGTRAEVVKLAQSQVAQSRTDACVANGPAYGAGFGLVTSSGEVVHLADKPALFQALLRFVDCV